MPKQSKQSTPASILGRLPVRSSHPVTNNSGRNMPPTTRSMQQQRLSTAPQGSLPSVRAVSARNTPQPGTAQRMTASANSRDGPESSDNEDDDDDDDDDESDGDDSSEDDDADGGNSTDDSDDDDDEPAAMVLRLFAIAEPNGVVPDEVNLTDVAQTVSDEASRRYRALMNVVANEAERNDAFARQLSNLMSTRSDAWNQLMCNRLRTRWDLTMLKFDQNPSNPRSGHDVINTANRLELLIRAVALQTQPRNWACMQAATKQLHFSLLLDMIRDLLSRNHIHAQRNRGSRGSTPSPYVTESHQDANLYQRMFGMPNHTRAFDVMEQLFRKGGMSPLDATQVTHLDTMLRELEGRNRLSETPGPRGSPPQPQALFGRLHRLNVAIEQRRADGAH